MGKIKSHHTWNMHLCSLNLFHFHHKTFERHLVKPDNKIKKVKIVTRRSEKKGHKGHTKDKLDH